MNVITITREYGAGGAEVARQLAQALGWELLDRELLHQAAQIQHVPDAELERLDEHAITMADRFRLHPPHLNYLEGLRQAVHQAAERGRVVLVGRGARHLLGERPDCLHVRLVAPRAWRAARMARLEGWSPEVAQARCTELDRTRQQFARYFFGDAATQPAQYDFVANTGRVPLEDVVAVVSDFVTTAATVAVAATASKRVLTLSREFGAGDQGFAPPLAERLGLHVCDREMLEQQAIRLGVPEAELDKIDEQPAGIFERFRPGSLYQRYFQVLEQLTRELAARGDILLVGRGGCWFLRDHPTAFHVRLIATMATRLRRVMEYRWVREEVAQKLITQSDEQRRGFCENYFGADWRDPLEYHVTVNSGRLGPLAVDLVALAAQRYWKGGTAISV
ncbi:MAG: cytidylate kinase-like family protein [Pirellulaceae bacterium]